MTDEPKKHLRLSDYELNKAVNGAVEKFLGMKDYEILERNYMPDCLPVEYFDYVTMDLNRDELVFMIVNKNIEGQTQARKMYSEETIAGMENTAKKFIADHKDLKGNIGVRFDDIDVDIIDTERGFLKHRLNCIS